MEKYNNIIMIQLYNEVNKKMNRLNLSYSGFDTKERLKKYEYDLTDDEKNKLLNNDGVRIYFINKKSKTSQFYKYILNLCKSYKIYYEEFEQIEENINEKLFIIFIKKPIIITI